MDRDCPWEVEERCISEGLTLSDKVIRQFGAVPSALILQETDTITLSK